MVRVMVSNRNKWTCLCINNRSAQPGEADANGVGLGRGGPISAGMGGAGMAGMMGGGRGRGRPMKGVRAMKGRGGA